MTNAEHREQLHAYMRDRCGEMSFAQKAEVARLREKLREPVRAVFPKRSARARQAIAWGLAAEIVRGTVEVRALPVVMH